MGNSNNCGLSGIFGTCQDDAKKNAENIERLHDFSKRLTDYVQEIQSESNSKFFQISNELAEITKIQREMRDNQNRNWKVIQQQFETFQSNFHILRDCTQVLFSNQQLNFNFDTIASLLSIIYADIQSYRAALFSYRLNLLNSIPNLLQQRLSMSIVPRESLQVILDSVHEGQKRAADRLTLAIPAQDLLSYYDARLLRDVITTDEGLLLTLSIPLASSQTAFHVYKAQVVPMPQLNPKEALQWVIEGPYLAISEDSMESTVLSEDQLSNCLGSSKFRICHETLETHRGHSSCLATFFHHSTLAALSVCETEKVFLPSPERAKNLGYGIWLITSNWDAFSLREYSTGSAMTRSKDHPDCHICLITLDCGQQLISKHGKFRPDLSTCDKIPAKRIQMQLAHPLKSLLTAVPNIEDLPYFESESDAGILLLREVKSKLSSNPTIQIRKIWHQ